MGVRCEGVKGATAKPPCRLRRGEIPAFGKEQLWSQDQQFGRAHLARQCANGRKSGLGGASADARSYWQGRFAACALLAVPFELVARGTVGALPQTPQGTLSLDPARGNCPLTPSRDSVGRFVILLPRVNPFFVCFPGAPPPSLLPAPASLPPGGLPPTTLSWGDLKRID